MLRCVFSPLLFILFFISPPNQYFHFFFFSTLLPRHFLIFLFLSFSLSPLHFPCVFLLRSSLVIFFFVFVHDVFFVWIVEKTSLEYFHFLRVLSILWYRFGGFYMDYCDGLSFWQVSNVLFSFLHFKCLFKGLERDSFSFFIFFAALFFFVSTRFFWINYLMHVWFI